MKKKFLRIALALAINASLVSAAVNAESGRQIYLGRENQYKNKGIKLDPVEEKTESDTELPMIVLGRGNEQHNKQVKESKQEVDETESEEEAPEILLGRDNQKPRKKSAESKKSETEDSSITEEKSSKKAEPEILLGRGNDRSENKDDGNSDVESSIDSDVASIVESVLEAPESVAEVPETIPEITLGRGADSTVTESAAEAPESVAEAPESAAEAPESAAEAPESAATPADADAATAGLANPFQPCDTLEEAAEIAGFTFDVPTMIVGLSGYEIQAVKDDMIQVIFGNVNENNDNVLVLRKARGSEDISGDSNEYSQIGMLTVNNNPVCIKGEKNLIYVATWEADGCSYAIDSSKGMSEAMLRAIAEVMH